MRFQCFLRSFCAATAVVLAPFVALAAATTYPAFVSDAQVSIPSSDGFSNPRGLAVAPGGTVYVADTGKSRVLRISPSGVQTTVSFGTLKPALERPVGIALDSSGNLYVTDAATNRVIKLPAGSSNGLTIITGLNAPTAIAVDSAGNLAILNSGNNTITERRGGGPAGLFNLGSTTLVTPTCLAFNKAGALYVGDQGAGGGKDALYLFPRLGGTAANVTPAGVDIYDGITGIATDEAGNAYLSIANPNDLSIAELPASGAPAFVIPIVPYTYYGLSAVAVDSIGNVYFADTYSNTVSKLYYNNAANFGSVPVGTSSPGILFNFAFYQNTYIDNAQALSGGVISQEYARGVTNPPNSYPCEPGGGNPVRYEGHFPVVCTLTYTFKPTTVGGRPGAIRLKTSAGTFEQLVTGTGEGAQIALMNAVVAPKLTQYHPVSLIGDASGSHLYFSNYNYPSSTIQGTFELPASASTATMVSAKGGLLAVNGAGDLFIFDGTEITKIPSDGTATSTIPVPASVQGTPYPLTNLGFAMDYNGAFYIANSAASNAPFLTRISATGVASTVPRPFPGDTPLYLTADLDGNLYEAGFDIAKIEVGTGSYQITEYDAMVGGDQGDDPTNLAVDESQTLYYYSMSDFATGLQYRLALNAAQPPPPPPGVCIDSCSLPLYTIPGVQYASENGLYVPFIPQSGNQQIATAPNGKMYFINGQASGILLVDRTQGTIRPEAFQPGYQGFGGPNQDVSVYNIGNQPLVFNNSSTFTQSGDTSAFTFAAPSSYPACEPGTSVIPTQYCAIQVTDANPAGSPLAVDTLHFLTNAVNNNGVSFKITGPPAVH